VIETERLILRPWEQADLPILASFSTDPVLMHHFGRAELSTTASSGWSGCSASTASSACRSAPSSARRTAR
jgi:RimJ/RimL family protein N-acetyltransferase